MLYKDIKSGEWKEYLNSNEVQAKLKISKRCQQYWCHEKGLLEPDKGPKGKRLYNWHDLLQLKVIKTLRDEGVTLKKIGLAIDKLRKDSPFPKTPLINLRLHSDRKAIYVCKGDKVYNAVSGQGYLFTWHFKDFIQETAKIIEFPKKPEYLKIRDAFPEIKRAGQE